MYFWSPFFATSSESKNAMIVKDLKEPSNRRSACVKKVKLKWLSIAPLLLPLKLKY
jgi:hypothetical protein